MPQSPLITPHRLAALEEPVVLLDVRWRLGGPPGREEYLRGHLPGAAYVDLETDLADPPGPRGRHPLPDPARFEEAMRRCGVRNDRGVVVYDDAGGTSAARCWWLLRHHGHRRTAVLDGGLAAWVTDGVTGGGTGGGLEEGDPVIEPGDFTAGAGVMPVVGADDLAAVVARGVLVDARAPERFRGEHEPVDPVAGHIPGAVNVPTAAHLEEPGGRFRDAAALTALYEHAGVVPGRQVAVYCGSGVTAAQGVLALEALGLTAALYPGSWSEWVHPRSRPVATGP